MTTVLTVVHPGFVEVRTDDLVALVEVAERHVDALENAAADGLLALLDLLCSRGLLVMPAFGIAQTSDRVTRVVLRGAVRVRADDGDETSAAGREPWADLDLAGAEVVTLLAPEPEPVIPRGWRRPAVLAAASTTSEPERESEPVGEAEAQPVVEPEPSLAEDRPVPDVSVAPDAGANEGVGGEAVEDVSVAPGAGATESSGGEAAEDVSVAPDAGATDSPRDDVPPEPAAPVEAPDAAAPVVGSPDEPSHDVPRPPVPADLTLPPPEDGPSGPPASRVPPSAPPETGIISSVPWRRGGASAPPGAAADPSAASAPAPRGPSADVPAPPPPPSPHDTRTDTPPEPQTDAPGEVPSGTAAPEPADPPRTEALPAPGSTPRPDPGPVEVTTARGSLPRSDEDLDRPVVLAVLCPAGHHSPPHAGRCRQCGREIPPQQPAPIPRPSLGVLRISTGGTVPLDRGVLLGRAPRVNEELPPNQRPHLIRVGSVDRDISRNHAEVVLEGWHVLVRDLGSTNGTTVALPGEEPVRLRPTEDQGIEPGSVITLADEVSLTYEVEG